MPCDFFIKKNISFFSLLWCFQALWSSNNVACLLNSTDSVSRSLSSSLYYWNNFLLCPELIFNRTSHSDLRVCFCFVSRKWYAFACDRLRVLLSGRKQTPSLFVLYVTMHRRSPVFKGRKREGQTDEQSVSLRGLVCLVGASLGDCPGASVAWRRGTRLRSDRWRWALSESLPVRRIDCRDLSQCSCSLLNLPYKRKPYVMLWIFRTVFFLSPGGCFRKRRVGVKQCVLVLFILQRWAVSEAVALMPAGSNTAIVLVVLSFIFCCLYCSTARHLPFQCRGRKKQPLGIRCSAVARFWVNANRERSRDWVKVRCKYMFWSSSIDSLCGIMSITTENNLNSYFEFFLRQGHAC